MEDDREKDHPPGGQYEVLHRKGDDVGGHAIEGDCEGIVTLTQFYGDRSRYACLEYSGRLLVGGKERSIQFSLSSTVDEFLEHVVGKRRLPGANRRIRA